MKKVRINAGNRYNKAYFQWHKHLVDRLDPVRRAQLGQFKMSRLLSNKLGSFRVSA